MTELVLGIDTGGTYTDGVLLDYHTREVIKTTKTLTTRHDLSICILNALDALLPDDPTRIKLVAISTTLATNAIAEGKGRPVALFLLGYDPELVRKFQFESKFATPRYYFIEGGHNLYGQEQAPLDLDSLLKIVHTVQNQVDAFAVSGYFSPFNADHEEAAFQAITSVTDQPVVLGHQLASRLNSVQRATTATLNASLLSVLHEFITAMRGALQQRNITAPLMVVRGDGSLMSAEVAHRLPVETVHSGPAASAIGGHFLARQNKALVIDIGGTTTDLAVVDGGRVTVREEGTTVGPYHTAVRAARVRSIGLGGDSVLGLDMENRLTIGPGRVVPLSYLAHVDPYVARHVRGLPGRMHKRPSMDHLEYWFLQRTPRRPVTNERAKQVLALLQQHPQPLPAILRKLGILHPLQFDGQRLIDQEIIGRAAFTPTDLLHLTGEYTPWDVEAARVAAELTARLLNCSVEQLIERVKTMMAERIAAEVVSFLSGQTLHRTQDYTPPDDLGLWLFEESLYRRHPYLGSQISLKIPIIGIGAPAQIFLPRVAQLLNTELILPPHFRVANAVGAVAGTVNVTYEAWIFPKMSGMNVVAYYVQLGPHRRKFPTMDEAIAYARHTMAQQLVAEAKAAGAVDPQVEFEHLPDGAETYRIRGSAMGSPRLGE